MSSEAKNDAPQFPLNQLYFYLTRGCNLRCRHCWIDPAFQSADHTYPALDAGLFGEILREAKPLGLSGVKLTGGEPLLHPDILELLEAVRQEDLRLTVETNGTLCTPEVVAAISACKNPFVSVSLDGDDAAVHDPIRGVKGCFDRSVEGLRRLVEAGLRPQVIMSVMRGNRDRMTDVVRLAESLGAGSVKFNVVQPTARGESLHKRGEVLDIRELVALGQWVERELSKTSAIRVIFSHPPAFRPLSRMFGDEGCGVSRCGIFGILGVLFDGSYALCGIGETVPELVFGKAGRDPIERVWNESPVLNQLREELPANLKGLCTRCRMRQLCLGECVAQNYYSTRDLFSTFWFCRQAEAAGLFPESRMIPEGREAVLEPVKG